MANSINRRNWIRSSAFIAGGLAFCSGTISKLSAMPKRMLKSPRALTDREVAAAAPFDLKARLLANENPFGPSPAAKKAIADALDKSYQYPFMLGSQLSGKIAKHEGVGMKNILMDSGSTPLLHAAAICFTKGGKSVITGDPSYDDLPTYAEEFDGKWVKVPLTSDYKLDLDAMEAKVDANTGMVYICNPNNPTATVVDTAKLKAFCERVSKKTMVFIDEAYIDYLPDPQGTTMISQLKAGNNIIIARTFSKLYGFAGLRLGYAIAQPETIKMLKQYSSDGFNISSTTLAAAIAAYQEKDFLAETLKKTNESKEYLYSVLKEEGYTYIPSSANFVMFPIKMDGKKFSTEMFKRGVGIRDWKLNGQDWCRISIGRMDEMEAFAAAFKEIS
ncbi:MULTISPECIES: histidinol-phosphate transaminase [unclassified Mucilaginibacter]|uniref:pyridoxal phosphate-dependent aminotransferase n=1 Tax=unclassified Mucilaginibacter TaxID=2617802 RepID=UPI002AC93D68|nr:MULTISPECIES: histidinol-phosphate transaminase [unclassified Mucilaginibacter]MEB0260322.1 histidinol-phosphate transaminase [Mucilaginibacter sp. 10I4]MEB0279361.1 histidinol-phosphate transaminase [Mucilaginibacter sp. 10B2]MEB0302217.1 histidinol-phosphate transaminase [Mucilaginibacter sp. 5C4]WPX21734.1 histidinol-phosphate transaminase [Mucilaginibacter sp. 5C4]